MVEEFRAKIIAELDTKDVEKKLSNLTKDGKKVKIEIDTKDVSSATNKIEKLSGEKIKVRTEISGIKSVDGLTDSLDNANKSAKNLDTSFKSISTAKLKYDAFQMIEQQCKNAVSAVKELNDAMTLVSMTMLDMPESNLKSLASQSLDMAKELSAYSKTVTDAMTIYANANESVNSILEKAQPTVLLASASNMSASNAADTIQGIMNQFHIAEDEAMNIADVVEKLSTEISVDFSKGISDISNAISVSGSVVDEAGMSFEKYASIVAAASEKTRENGSVLGNAYKTIFSRISRSKDGETTDAEKAQAEKALNSIGVSVRGLDGDIRNVSYTLDDLNQVWGTLNRSQKSYIAEQSAGLRQKNIFISTMDTYNRALELEQKALDSEGTATKINKKRVDSIDGKMQRLSAVMTKLYTDAVSDDAVKGMLDYAAAVAEVADKFSLLQGAIATAGVMGMTTMVGKVATNWASVVAMLSNPATLFAAGIGAVVSAVSVYKKSVAEMVESARQAGDAWESSNDSIQSQIDKIIGLRTELDSGKLTEEEAYTAKANLLDIQNQLSESYGNQVSGIALVNGSLEEQIELLNRLSQAEANKFLNENRSGIAEAEKQMAQTRHTVLGQFDIGMEDEDSVRRLDAILTKYADRGISAINDNGMVQIQFDGDATLATEVLNDFMTDVWKASDETGDINFFETYSKNAEEGLNVANKVLEDHKKTVEQAAQARLVANTELFDANGKSKTAADWIRDYAKAVQAYNDALATGDSSKIAVAADEFAKMDFVINGLAANTGMGEFSEQINEVRSGLNEAAIATVAFNDALSGKNVSGNTSLENIYKQAEILKDLALTDVDFKYALSTDGLQDSETHMLDIVAAAKKIGFVSDSSSESINKIADALLKAGIISGQTAKQIEEPVEQLSSFSSLLSDVSEGGFTEKISDYTSRMEKLTSAKDSLNKTGGKLDTSDLKDLLNDIPELSNYIDDLEGGIDSLMTTANNETLSYFADKIQELKDAGKNADAAALEAYAQSVIDSANEIEGAFIRIGGLKINTPNLSEWENPQENAGAAYDKILSGYEAAKKAYENGEVGTSSFKSFAKMISPTGSDDAANFAENMSRFERYFQDGSDGCLNFLQDLEALSLAEENNGKWTYKLGNSMDELKSTAEKMGIGFEPFMAMFGKLEDYEFHNDFFTTEEDGAQHVSELYNELAAEKRRLAEIEANPNTEGYETAVQASEDKIAGLKERIQQCNQAIDDMGTKTPEEIAERAEYAKSVAKDLQEQIENTDDGQLKSSLQQQLDDFAAEHNLVIDVETGDITSLEEAVSGIDGVEIDLNARGSDLDSQIGLLSGKLEELRNGDPLNIDTSQITSAETVLGYLIDRKHELEHPAVMNISAEQLGSVGAQLSSAITAVQNFQTAYNELEKAQTLGVDTSEAQTNLNNARAALDSIDDETKKTLNLDVEGLDDVEAVKRLADMDLSAFDGLNKLSYEFNITNEEVLDGVIQKLKELPEETENISITIDSEVAKTNLETINTAILNYKESHPSTEITLNGSVVTIASLAAINGLLTTVDSNNPNPQIKVSDMASSTISSVSNQLIGLDGKVATTYINVVRRDSGGGADRVNGSAYVNGTPRIQSARFNDGYLGTARARGTWGEPEDTVALTGEEERELVVRGNHFFTVGDNGPEMVSLKKGDIVFNARQTREILSKGHTTGRGRALAEGNARVGGGTLGGKKPSSSTQSSSGTTVVNNYTTNNYNGTGQGKSSSGSSKGNGGDKDSIDWIEVKLDRLERKIKHLKNTADDAYKTFSVRNKALEGEISQVTSEIGIQEKAYDRYIAEADSVKLKSSLKKKVRNGTIDINKYNDKTKEQIGEYKQWYEKALDCKDAISDLNVELTELYRQQFDNIVTRWTNALQNLEHAAERTDSIISRRSDYAGDYVSGDYKESASYSNITDYQGLVKNAQSRIDKKAAELVELRRKLNEAVADSANTGIYEGSEGYYEMLAGIQDVEKEIDSLNSDIISYSNSISEAYMDIFDNIAQGYEDKLELAGHLANEYNNSLEMAEAKGYIATGKYYEMLKGVTADNITVMKQEQKELNGAFLQALSSGEIQTGSRAWADMKKQINDVAESISKAELEMEEFNKTIRETKWEQFDYLEERISRVSDEVRFFTELMSGKKLFDDKGKFTAEGTATLGMYGLNYNVFMKQADDYAAEILEINKELEADPYNTDIIARKEELLELQQQSILAAEDEKKAILSLVRDGIEQELSSLKDLIDSYADALDSQKDLYDYQKRVAQQAENIASLQKQLSAYENDISEETKAKIQKIRVELESAKEDLEETQYEKYISDQKKLLDDLYNEYERTLNERLDNLDALVAEVIDYINRNAAFIDSTLKAEAEKAGYTMSDTMSSIWGQASAAFNADAAQRVKDVAGIVSELVNNGRISEEKADEILTALGEGNAQDVQNTLELLARMGAGGVMSPEDIASLNEALTNSATPTNNTLSMYSSDFNDKATTANMALKGIETYVNALVKQAEAEALAAQKKMQEEEAARKAAEQAAAQKGNNNTQNTKPAAQEATTNKVTDKAQAEGNKNQASSPAASAPAASSKEPAKTDSTQGDGKIQVGDKVTFKSGQYYYSSDGISPKGNQKLGKTVYITKINKSSWATHPYHVSTGKKLGSGDLGWLKKSQISGYARGAKKVTDEFAWTNENWNKNGGETILRKSDNAVLTPTKDARIYNAMASENMWQMANSPYDFVQKHSAGARAMINTIQPVNSTSSLDIGDITINLPSVTNFEEFRDNMLDYMQKSKGFENFIQSITVDRMLGKSRTGKYRSKL